MDDTRDAATQAVLGNWLGPVAVLIPVKSFRLAKLRLAAALPASGRAALAQAMATRVLTAAQGVPVAVVCDDPEVARWARDRGALVVWEPGRGLNGAVEAGIAQLASAGVQQVVVAHADLPLASHLGELADPVGAVTLVPDRREDGTNVASIPTTAGFRFAYGPGSFARHSTEARRLGLDLIVLHSPSLAYDVDLPADLAGLPGAGIPTNPH